MKNKILIIDENAVNDGVLYRLLADEYTILQAFDGEEAFALIKKEYKGLSAVILDLQIPKMDGRTLLGKLAKDDKYTNLPVLVATGEHNNELESECLRSGAWDFITKPYNPIVLRLRLHNIIGRSQTYLMQRIQVLAEQDVLTGVYNRSHFMKTTSDMLRENPEITFALIRMDINQFRLYNSYFGSRRGDDLLRHIAGYIVESVEKNGYAHSTYGRIESDVFGICVPYDKEKLEEEMYLAEKNIQNFCSNYRLKISFGLYVIEDCRMDIEQIYANSVEASRKSKTNLNTVFSYYMEDMGKQQAKAQTLTNEMERAIEEKQFHVYLQPKYSVEKNIPCGAEALARWIHPEWGMVSPGEFIPVFEQNGLIIQLDYYMWESVCALFKQWMDKGFPLYPVSVNVSRVSMYNPKIVDKLVELTNEYHVPRHLLNLEITESAYMSNPDLMKEIIEKLRSNGFVILMDDFGSGYSSLNTLKDIEVDILKVDMKFLPTGQNNAKSEKILAAVIRMAGWLGMPVIVEGVETREQRDFLESIGCSYVQGYLYARPMPVKDYEGLIRQQENEKYDAKMHHSTELLDSFDTIWSSDSDSSTLLKSISVPFAILEYSNHKLDILRRNMAYTNEFGNRELERYLIQSEYDRFMLIMDEMIISKQNAECECLFIMTNGENRWYQIRLKYIGTVEKTSLISATFSDVTVERMLERELNTVFNALKDKPRNKGALLVVDDLEISRESLRALFEDEYEIITAQDGQEALMLLEENMDRIAAILLDMLMPNMNGQEFLSYKNKLSNAAEIPVMVISSEDSEAVQIHMLENGVNDYVTKPFVPAVVKRRLDNVVEYNSRFRTLVQEYREINELSTLGKKNADFAGYTITEVREMIHFMNKIFDLVRIVDPKETAVITIQPNGTVSRQTYSCFSVWGELVRCDNCSSLCALNGHCAKTKFELLKKDVFYVISQPIPIFLEEGKEEPVNLVLEIASRISDEHHSDSEESDNLYHIIEGVHKKIYMDSLTGAFNRRFLDESLFLHHGQNAVAKKVALILFDLFHFKQVNDLFGHQVGDRVLAEVVAAVKTQIRQNDVIIRYGGDEFIVILTNCDENIVERSIARFQEAVATVKYGPKATITTEADFGYAFTENFHNDEKTISDMIRLADEKMYENKRSHQIMGGKM